MEIESILAENLRVVQMEHNVFFVFMVDTTVPGKLMIIQNSF